MANSTCFMPIKIALIAALPHILVTMDASALLVNKWYI
jgi:hypothetical protein